MRRMPLLLVVIAALPAARAVPADRSTHGRLTLLHEIEDDVRELDATLEGRDAHAFERTANDQTAGDKHDRLYQLAAPGASENALVTALKGDLTKEEVTYVDPETKNTVLIRIVLEHEDWDSAAGHFIEFGCKKNALEPEKCINAQGEGGNTALHYASIKNVRILLEGGAGREVKNNADQTAAQFAVALDLAGLKDKFELAAYINGAHARPPRATRRGPACRRTTHKQLPSLLPPHFR